MNNDYKQEIIELTRLLNDEWNDLRAFLEEVNIPLNGSLLVAHIEDEDGNESGIIITAGKEIFHFFVSENGIEVSIIDNLSITEKQFPQIPVALSML